MHARTRCAALLIVAVLGSSISLADKKASPRSRMMPPTLLLIRHAEKPSDEEKSSHLSADGLKRAAALADLFKPTKLRPDPFPVPDIIFAAKSSKQSQRPLETVAALARTLRVTVNANDGE